MAAISAHMEPVTAHRAVITACAMLATVMQTLDTTIANVALPYIQGSLSASPDQISWVLTSYIVASAIAIPITGWLADRVGRKPLFVWAVIAFTIASLLCAIIIVSDGSIDSPGAALGPLSQAVMLDLYPP